MKDRDLAQPASEISSLPAHEEVEQKVEMVEVPMQFPEERDAAQGEPVASTYASDVVSEHGEERSGKAEFPETAEAASHPLPLARLAFLRNLSPFWHDHFIEAGLIGSLGLYYVIGNLKFGATNLGPVPPYLYSLPFLLIFALLSWYRLAFALALMPLALPYYLIQKTVFSTNARHLDFSLIEIGLAVCTLIALLQWLVYRKKWRYALAWREIRDRLGPFSPPIALFVVAAGISVLVALDRSAALRTFRQEIFDPLLYLVLALCCLRTRQDLSRLLGAFLGSAMIIALIGLVQYFFFADQLQQSLNDGGRILAVYGSANSIGLFFDYVLPIGFSLLLFQVAQARRGRGTWVLCALLLVGFVPLLAAEILSQSLGAALALPVALLFLLALSLRWRVVLTGGGVLLALALLLGFVFREQIVDFITHWHVGGRGVGTFTKRYYLWMTAFNMIRAFPWTGVGLDNWLCYYSRNNLCPASHTIPKPFAIYIIPGTHVGTGLGQELTLSHPHDIFLHVWVSIGIFGLVAFLAVLVLFYWLFARILQTLRPGLDPQSAALRWIVLGLGASMLAALFQGLIDSSFLEQDLVFCFWMLLAALLVLRVLTRTSWRKRAV